MPFPWLWGAQLVGAAHHSQRSCSRSQPGHHSAGIAARSDSTTETCQPFCDEPWHPFSPQFSSRERCCSPGSTEEQNHTVTHTAATGTTALGAGVRSKERSSAGGTWSRALGQQARDRHGSRALTTAAPQCAEEEERSRFHRPRGRAAASRGFPSFPLVGEQVLPAGAVPFWLPAPSPALLKALQEPPPAFPPAGYFQRGFLVLFKVQLPPSSAAPCPGDLWGSCCIAPPGSFRQAAVP